jgi:hypothetical protein
VRAQRRFFDLRQLPVEAKRRLQACTLTLEGSVDSHMKYDARCPQELDQITGQPVSAFAVLSGERVRAAYPASASALLIQRARPRCSSGERVRAAHPASASALLIQRARPRRRRSPGSPA